MYLQYWDDNGAVKSNLQSRAEYLLTIMNTLNFYTLKTVLSDEIERAANCWARDEENHHHRKNHYSKLAKARFIREASHWFEMLNCLEQPIRKQLPFETYLNQYIDHMRHERGLSENTIRSKFYPLKNFLANINEKKNTFIELTPLIIDEVLIKKYNIDGYTRKSVRSYISVIRSFLRYAENKGWCQKNLASTIKAPRVYRHESLPCSPSWSDVKKILENSHSDQPTDIRDHAILMLLSIYGMRCSEVTNLRLSDIDWKNESLSFQSTKTSKPRIFPLSQEVAEAILRYLKVVRPNNCLLREVFLCRQAPYRRLRPEAIYQIVNRRLKPFNLNIQHHGPHTLRHACATHLINEGLSLKEISTHLGHQCLETTQIYAKVDLKNLRKVAEFELGDLL
jgi:site-specific recombinase XerD